MAGRSQDEANPSRRRWRLPPFFRRRRRTKSVEDGRAPSASQGVSSSPSDPLQSVSPGASKPTQALALDWDFEAPLKRRPSFAVTEDRFTQSSWLNDLEKSERDTFSETDDGSSREDILSSHLISITDRGVQTELSCLNATVVKMSSWKMTPAEEVTVKPGRILLLPFVIWFLFIGFLLRATLSFICSRAQKSIFGTAGSSPGDSSSAPFYWEEGRLKIRNSSNPITVFLAALVLPIVLPLMLPIFICESVQRKYRTVQLPRAGPRGAGLLHLLFSFLRHSARSRPSMPSPAHPPRLPRLPTWRLTDRRPHHCRCRCNVM